MLLHKSCRIVYGSIQIIKPCEQVPSGWPTADVNFSESWKGLDNCFSHCLGLLPAKSKISACYFPGTGQVMKFLMEFKSILNNIWLSF